MIVTGLLVTTLLIMKMNRRNLLCLMFLICNAFAFAQEQDVYHSSTAGTDNWWDALNPWFYVTAGTNQNRPDNNNGGVTRHRVEIGHNNNTGMNINGAFFTLKSLRFTSGATNNRTFTDDNLNYGLAFTTGIYNESSGTHTFYARVAADANINISATNGILVFDRQIFTNGNTITFNGPQNINISGFISQTGSIIKELGGTLTLSGANTFTGTTTINGGTIILNRTGGGTLPAANDITINNGGTLQVSTNQTLDILTVNAGSTLQVDANTTLTITGAFTGGGTIINNGRIVLNGTALQSFPGVGATISAMNELEINNSSGTGVNMNSSIAITGSLILTNGTLNIAGNLLDLNGASLSRTLGFLNGSNTSDFTVRENTGGTVTIPLNGVNISLRTVTISGNRVVAMNGVNNIALSGAFNIASGATYDNGGESRITQNTGGTITIDGIFITRDEQGFTGTNASIPGIVPLLNSGCTIEYGRAGDQAVQSRIDYSNVTFSNSGIKTLASGCNPASTVYITGSAIFDQSNNTFGNSGTSLTMDGGRYRLSGTTNPKPDIDGVYSLTGGVIEFYSSVVTRQNIKGISTSSNPINYLAIEVTGSNVGQSTSNITLQSGGTFTIKNGGVFTSNIDAIVGLPGNQTVTVESGGKFICGDVDGFSGGIGSNTTSIRSDIETINLNTGSTVEYSRATAQVFSARTDYKNVIISGGGAKTLNGDVTISGLLTLTSGLVNTTTTELLTLSSTATCPGGGSTSSFVNGPMQKTGNTDFSFPVGQLVVATPHYRTIGIVFPSSGTGATTQAFTTQFRRADSYTQGGLTATAITNGLQRVSRCEYWDLTRSGVGAENVGVTLSWEAQSRCNVGNYVTALSSLVVVQYNGSAWGDLFGRTSTTGTTSAGTITWSGALLYNKFTLGSTDASQNPLPFNLSSFTAGLKQKTVDLNWKVSNNNEQKEYILERSKDAIQFEVIASISANANLTVAEYNYTDAQPVTGWNYYRLRATDHQNKTQTSSIIKVWMGKGAFISVLPNPASEKIVINLSEPSSILQMQIVNTTGQVLRQLNTIQFLNEINISNLQAGMYYIRFLGKDGVTTKSFIKH